ncbi:MAG TPA: dipeptide/oligopeptide/nickel ABC transporter ATP-binding protein [Rhizobiaceae bacterium]|nr:dipeptide/oligopeptide/nickel ABC transporter ATP-binding protein [Rhizobiaceae bacterium]
MTLVATNLTKTFISGHGSDRVHKLAVDNVSIKVDPGDFVAVVGESGSGKSTSARMMLDLIRPDSGTVALDGADVASMSRADKKRFRSTVQAIFQDPSGSLNPRKRIRTILGEVIRFYGLASTAQDVERTALKSLELVGLDPPETYMERFPHELSGGQRQRVLIARSMIPDPKIIIADEAVSALDVSVKAGVLRLMEDLRRDKGVGYLLITHDLPVVRKVASYVYVMRNGAVVEEGPTERIFLQPQAEYTRNLLGAGLDLDTVLAHRRQTADYGGTVSTSETREF